MDWYENNIEEPVRDIVKHLRNQGFNTECSCGHDMYIQCQCIHDGEIYRLHTVLFNYHYSNGLPINYEITGEIKVTEGNVWSSITIQFPKKSLSKEEYDAITNSAKQTTKHDGYEFWLKRNHQFVK